MYTVNPHMYEPERWQADKTEKVCGGSHASCNLFREVVVIGPLGRIAWNRWVVASPASTIKAAHLAAVNPIFVFVKIHIYMYVHARTHTRAHAHTQLPVHTHLLAQSR